MSNKISIAVPAHNEEDSIQRNLASIISSDFKKDSYEITVCLSNCTDKTREKIEEFKKNNKKVNIQIIEQKKPGKVLAYKTLDKHIKNEIVVFIDADCGSKNDAIWKIYNKLKKSPPNIQVVSANAVDPRYTDKKVVSRSVIESFNRAFWQHPPRKIINGQCFAARKGVVQEIPDEIKLDDVYMSIILWNNFIKDNSAQIIQGSAQTMYEVLRYQKNIQAGKLQIQNHLSNKVNNFQEISKNLYKQFDINFSDKKNYYPNLPYVDVLLIKILIFIATIWGKRSKPSWAQTKSSKEIAIN